MPEDGWVSGVNSPVLVPVSVKGHHVLVTARDVPGGPFQTDAEVEIAARKPQLDRVLDGLVAFANEMVERFESTDASKVSVQFGCDVAVETGTLVAVIGKASVQSTFTVTLEWARQGN
jgi:hypothetical protein